MKHIEVVAAVILFNQKVLCMQRGKNKHDYISYKYEFPGGKIEDGESKAEALIRELKEEMNIDINISEEDHFLTVDHTYPDFTITMYSYICNVETDTFIRKEHINHVWLPIEILNTLDWAQADKPIVVKLQGENKFE
ncbi:MAG TPA: (deoxy)nucleoside triphosphate pyrophosphohydrolase [Clostridia bacterium]|jgi:8-oxo-dGTP diphosphatase|nr:MAG: 8-oxo-dGTP diphosphatase [Firmicutes bacterium ADurb.Bin146]HOD93419.1 (deoxy)nucleoside triphosphate pyrophosphohydrolase [Clostridia bacterium]HQM39682.1 (deoxy)nucleoside triphosphate pyrophosphohydrolase [Clostridia bacterium]